MAINLAELAFVSWQKEEEIARQKAVVLCRQFYDGIHDTKLSARQREYLNADNDHEFNVNIARTTVEAVKERLVITGVTSTDATLGKWADGLWEAAGGVVKGGDQSITGIMQFSTHEGVGRDGEYFVIVDWNSATASPRLTPHYRYASSENHGDGFGCKAHYPDDDINQPMQYASKRWIELLDTKGKTRNRMNLYFPDRVEKYEMAGNDWRKFQDPEDTAWPLPWVDRTGAPLGIPVIHFPATVDLRSDIWDAIPIQRGFNKAVLDLLAAADMTGFRTLITLGWIPTSDGQPPKADGSNRAHISPGTMLGTTKSKSEAGTETIDPADLTSLINALGTIKDLIHTATATPQSYYASSGGAAVSAETLKEKKERLFAKVVERQSLLTQSWLSCLNMARRLANAFGNAGLPEDAPLILQWKPIQSRSSTEMHEEWRVKKEMGIPIEMIWSEMGYSDVEIAAMKAMPEFQARLSLMQTGLDTNANAA